MGGGSKTQQPKEDPSAITQRERDIEQIAEIDDDENRRIKRAMAARQGVRAFRRSIGTSRIGGARGDQSSSSAAVAPRPSSPSASASSAQRAYRQAYGYYTY